MKKLKYWKTSSQVGALLSVIGVLITVTFFTIYQAKQITRVRETSGRLVQESMSHVNKLGFYAVNLANGADAYASGFDSLVVRLETNMTILEKGGNVTTDGCVFLQYCELKIPSLPTSAEDLFQKFNKEWITFKQSLALLESEDPFRVDTKTYFEDRESTDDFGNLIIEYDRVNLAMLERNPTMVEYIDKVSKEAEELAGSLKGLYNQVNKTYQSKRAIWRWIMVGCWVISLGALFAIFMALNNRLFMPLQEVQTTTDMVALGNLDCEVPTVGSGEISKLAATLNTLLERLKSATTFAGKIGNGEFESEFHVASKEDKLGYALLEMRDNLKKVDEEDQKRNWANEGMAKFGDILRSTYENEEELAYAVVANLVQYLEINQGGLFVKEEDFDGNEHLKLLAAYAFTRRKYMDRTLEIGEGLIGQAVLEGEVVYLTDVPEDYALIQSGMGEGSPRCVVIIPLKLNEEIYGAIELASFNVIERYQVDFLEKVSESISSTLATSRTNQRTKMLLEDSQQMTEEMKAQEEEMRQNMEELQATQEEMSRKQRELSANDHRFRQMTQNVPGMLFQMRMDESGVAQFIFASSASQNLLGLIPDEVVEAPDHEEVLRLVAEDADNYRKTLLTSAQDLTPLNWEGRILGSDGKAVRWIAISARPERDPDENIIWNGLINDITDKKKVEDQMRTMIKQLEAKDAQVSENVEALEQAKEELQFLNRELGAVMSSIENSVLMLELNKDLKIRKVNNNLLDLLGFENKDLLRKDLKVLFPDTVGESSYYKDLIASVKEGNYVETYTVWKNQDGEPVWIHLMCFVTKNEKDRVLKIALMGTAIPEDMVPDQPLVIS